MVEPIYLTMEKGSKVRIFTPEEQDRIHGRIEKPYLRTIFEVLFWTGVRYVEGQRLHEHPEYWQKDRGVIHLGREAQRKVRRVAPERYIPVPPQLSLVLPYFFTNEGPPHINTWRENLLRWAVAAGMDTTGITVKSTRATLESWMCAAGLPINWICLRQGHSALTSLNHYQAIPFTPAEILEIKRRLAGWV